MSTVEEARGGSAALEAAIAGPAIGDAVALRRDDDGALTASCAECGHELGSAGRDPKLGAVMRELSIADLSPLNAEGMTERPATSTAPPARCCSPSTSSRWGTR
jgi:hypothetical protein